MVQAVRRRRRRRRRQADQHNIRNNLQVMQVARQRKHGIRGCLTLNSQMNWEFIIGDVLVFSGFIYNFINKLSLWSEVSAFIAMASFFSQNVLPHVASIIGENSSLYQTLLQVASGLESAASWLEGLAAIYSSALWWEKKVIDASVAAFKVSSLGPEQMVVTALMTVAKPVLGFLLDAGAQYLYSRGYADQAEIERQKDMPIAQWCASYQGCPAY